MIELLPNSSFSQRLPWHQLAIDSTSLGEFKICPRRYYYGIILGYRILIQSVHLTFGIILHSSVEKYHQKRAEGREHELALQAAVQKCLSKSWDSNLQRPLAELCERPDKNRLTLLRSVVWYLDKFGPNDPLETIVLSNGKAAVELSFRHGIGRFSALTGEPYVLCGHIDRIGKLTNLPYISDIKTTGHHLDEDFFAQFTPDNQQSLYIQAGDVVWGIPIKSAIIDGIRVTALRTEFMRSPIQRSEFQLDEWFNDLVKWISKMEDCAAEAARYKHELEPNEAPPARHWEMNDKACGIYGGCPFRSVCSKSTPQAREDWLRSKYTRRVWDPLQIRGDI